MQLLFDVVVYASKVELAGAKQSHPKKFGWVEFRTHWHRKTKIGVVSAVLFYRISL